MEFPSMRDSDLTSDRSISTPDYFAPNDSLVLGFRFAEEDESLYPFEDVWFEDYQD